MHKCIKYSRLFKIVHAIPSRMTIGQLLESVIGKACSLLGFECDATAFSGTDPGKIAEILEKTGYEKYGTQEMYNGRNGTKIDAKIFIGPTYYQRLKHMSKDKIHARGIGPYQLLTRQPPEGRQRDGGLRFGELFAEKWNVKLLLVYYMVGNAIKLRGRPVCVIRLKTVYM